MAGPILLTILFILCVLLMLPVRLKVTFGDGKWSVKAYYAFFRVFRKESAEKPQPQTPPKPRDLPEGAPLPPEEPPPADTKPEKPKKKPKAQADSAPKPQTVSDSPAPEPEPQPGHAEPPAQSESTDTQAHAAEQAAADTESAAQSEQPEKPEKPKKRGFIQRLKPQSLEEGLGLVKDACASLSPALRFLTRHLHFRHIRLYLAVGSEDPANTATLYGKICAAAYPLLAALQCWVDIETDELRILADFYNESITFRAAAELRVSPMAVLCLVLILGIRFLWRTLCRFRREDKEAKRKARETAPA